MAYYIDLFSPETYQAFTNSDKKISGFRNRQRGIAASIQPGDKLICYVTKVSRWVGVLEITDKYFIDDKPIFIQAMDPFVVRFNVKTSVWFSIENGIPIDEDICWKVLSFTKEFPKNSSAWTGIIRNSLRKLTDSDGEYLENILLKQLDNPTMYDLTEKDKNKLKILTVKTQDSKQVTVSIPENDETLSDEDNKDLSKNRESIKIQALLAEIGERMDFHIWLPRNDRQKVLETWKPKTNRLIEILPLNYDDVTLKTIENIDVLWIKHRSIIRAFEIEHTTSIYSGILRMADLMALQPNLNIHAHIVAPIERKDKVIQEITRPVFAYLSNGPLSESCTYISYNSVIELSEEKKLEYMNDSVLSEYEEYAEEADI
jgi:hypothetical protein